MNPLVVVMGVSGCGKSTIGAALAARVGVEFADADDFHPAANKAKMHAGIPLTDADRAPWLATLAAWLREHHDTGAVMACSALKHTYRDALRDGNPDLFFVHLNGSRDTILARLNARRGHFMPPALLDSQFAALEMLAPDEAGVTLEIGDSPDELTDRAARAVAERARHA